MSKSAISFRVEAKLLAQFCNAALKENRIPIDVLREFITNYVRDVRQQKLLASEVFSSQQEADLSAERTKK
ncbi:hypothetical protein [Massilia varians]|uniref:hypothetical protein n=1 Tax=Massilia varians TaxID=457921 RepID=UPI002553A1E5|nr:hypothetical protein [Massilia varians]MDK6080429.1 hypothetical protein [Massilia varians]